MNTFILDVALISCIAILFVLYIVCIVYIVCKGDFVKDDKPSNSQLNGQLDDSENPLLTTIVDDNPNESMKGPSDVLRLVLIGETGCGKSTTGNTILDDDGAFTSLLNDDSKCCCKETKTRFGRKIEVIDTPGIFDSVTELGTFQREIVKCIAMTQPGPTAFLMVVRPYVLTTEQYKAFEKFLKIFGEEIYKHLIIIFTRPKETSENRRKIPEQLRNILCKCNNNLIYFDNHLKGIERDKQVKNLLELIDKQICKKAGTFKHTFYEEAERIITNSHNYLRLLYNKHTPEENDATNREIDQGKGLMLKILLRSFAKIFKAENFNVTTKPFRPISITDYELRIILFGLSGSGKSATGNTILNDRKFKSCFSSSETIHTCKRGTKERFGIILQVIDTPDIIKLSEDCVRELRKCVGLTAPGPHAILFVVQAGRFTQNNEKAISKLETYFGHEMWNYFVLIFSHGDEIQQKNGSLETFLNKAPSNLNQILIKCQRRCIAFNNKSEKLNERQVQDLITKIRDIILQNATDHFRNERYDLAENAMKEREENLMQDTNNVLLHGKHPREKVRDELNSYDSEASKLLSRRTLHCR